MGEFKVLLITKHATSNGSFIDAATKKFKGITIGTPISGRWINDAGVVVTDSVIPVYIATDDTAGVVRMVNLYRINSGEDCVYLRYPNGMVSLIGDRS
jgi:hypothetical protein